MTLPRALSGGFSSNSALVLNETASAVARGEFLSSRPNATSNAQLCLYFLLWYLLTLVNNVSTKKLLIDLPLPAFVTSLNLLLGIPLFLPVVFLRRPKFENGIQNIKPFSILGSVHMLGHLATLYSLSAGSVSFTHLVKAAEPIFAALFSMLILKQASSLIAYASLLPIIIGVSMASADASAFTTQGFVTAMMSNVCYQLRSVLAKTLMPNAKSPSNGPNSSLSPANVYRILTVCGAMASIPLCLILEGTRIVALWNIALRSGVTLQTLLTNILVSSFSFYAYNEVSFWVLGLVDPVTHSIGNCLKRVVIIVASSIILRTPHSLLSILGCVIAVLGTVAYAFASSRDKWTSAVPPVAPSENNSA